MRPMLERTAAEAMPRFEWPLSVQPRFVYRIREAYLCVPCDFKLMGWQGAMLLERCSTRCSKSSFTAAPQFVVKDAPHRKCKPVRTQHCMWRTFEDILEKGDDAAH